MLAFECLLMNSTNGNVYAVHFDVGKRSCYSEEFDHDALHKQLPLPQDRIGQIFPTIKVVTS